MKRLDLPCWLSPNDQEVAQALLEIDWIWLEDEEPEQWEDQTWEYKITRHRGWQFWGTPGETCLLVARNGACFGLCLEGRKLDFEEQLHKAKAAISQILGQQEARRPKQLCLFKT